MDFTYNTRSIILRLTLWINRPKNWLIFADSINNYLSFLYILQKHLMHLFRVKKDKISKLKSPFNLKCECFITKSHLNWTNFEHFFLISFMDNRESKRSLCYQMRTLEERSKFTKAYEHLMHNSIHQNFCYIMRK